MLGTSFVCTNLVRIPGADRKDSRQESERKTETNDVISMAEDYAMKTNDMLHAPKDRRKWKAKATYAHDGMVPGGGGGVLYIFWIRRRAIGKGIDFHDFGIRNGIDFHDFGIRNGINFRNFHNWYSVGYAFSENWYKVGVYIFEKLV